MPGHRGGQKDLFLGHNSFLQFVRERLEKLKVLEG